MDEKSTLLTTSNVLIILKLKPQKSHAMDVSDVVMVGAFQIVIDAMEVYYMAINIFVLHRCLLDNDCHDNSDEQNCPGMCASEENMFELIIYINDF